MEKEKNVQEYYAIDLSQIMKALWYRIWMIALAGVLAAAIGFSFATFIVPAKYSASIMLYVNNSSASGNSNAGISSSEISAARSLVKTYAEILKSRTTLEDVIEKANISCTYKDLAEMISAEASNDTEFMKVTVVCDNPTVAAVIANSIAEVLPVRVSEIIDGASMKVVDVALVNYEKIAPSITQYTVIGLFIGLLFSVGMITIYTMLDDTIYDEDFIMQNYKYPILARIPNLMEPTNSKNYGYYYQQTKDANTEVKGEN
jgi:capsular polysaccharide biosynthesis protein